MATAEAAIASDPPCSSSNCGQVSVSPGRSDLKLGVDFPNFTSVKLSYPNSTILTNSVGDLLFTVTLDSKSTRTIQGIPDASIYRSVDIYIPPDFSGLTIGKLWTSFTNDYDHNSLSLSRSSSSDQIGPNWWRITVYNLIVTSDMNLPNTNNNLTAHRVFLANQTQYIRLFQVTSPSIAGRYFFKAFVNGTSIGSANFPTLVVKASRDPAYISGTLRNSGDRDPSMAGLPINLPNGTGAQILATGIDYLGRSVSAQAFINSTAHGQYTLFGVAPGTYNITAYAAGFIPTPFCAVSIPCRPTIVSVLSAQSLESVDIYMSESVNVTGTVLSRTAEGGSVPWGFVSGFGGAVSRQISISLLSLDGSVVSSTPAPYRTITVTDPSSTFFDFSIQRELGFDGRIPQDYANYTSGLTSGDYLLRAYATSYIQVEDVRVHVTNETVRTKSVIPLIRTGFFLVTVHFMNSTSTITEDPIPVSGTLTVSAYDLQGILRAQNVTFVNAGSKEATVELQGFSAARSFGITSLFSQNGGLLPGTYHIFARFSSSPSYAGYANIGIRDMYYQTSDIEATIGLGEYWSMVRISLSMYKGGAILFTLYSIDDQLPPLHEPWKFPGATVTIMITDAFGDVFQTNATQRPGSAWLNFTYMGLLTNGYDITVRTLGYTQRQVLHVNVVLGGNSDAAIWMIENPVIDLTVAFKDEGLLSIINSTEPFAQPINHLDATPARVEVFDEQGNFVAANESYVPNISNGAPTTTAHFTLAGFDRYSGDPRLVWAGFYDTTDGATQPAGGLILYPWSNVPRVYTVRIWVEGYYQLGRLQVTVPARGNVSVVGSMDRASRISGTVVGPDLYDVARPLSWAIIDLEPNNRTLSSILDVRPGNFTTSSLDGEFQLWVPRGSYGMGVSLEGYSTYSAQAEVPSGSDVNMQIWLDNG